MFVWVPNTSYFPEIDFTAKCLHPTGESTEMARLLSPLSDGDSGKILSGLSGKRFYLYDAGGGQIAVALTRSKTVERIEED